MITQPMKPREIAARLGITIETFYRTRHKLHQIDKMPRPITHLGRAYDRAGMEAWLTRNDPRRPPAMAAANDAIAPPMPNSDAQWNEFLHRHYGQPAE
jgi:predicted DNA-binding transcriptional regulator AlpA